MNNTCSQNTETSTYPQNVSMRTTDAMEILKLAKECLLLDEYAGVLDYRIEAFYRAAFNAGLEAAQKALKHDCECGVPCDCYSPTTAKYQIKELEMK